MLLASDVYQRPSKCEYQMCPHVMHMDPGGLKHCFFWFMFRAIASPTSFVEQIYSHSIGALMLWLLLTYPIAFSDSCIGGSWSIAMVTGYWLAPSVSTGLR